MDEWQRRYYQLPLPPPSIVKEHKAVIYPVMSHSGQVLFEAELSEWLRPEERLPAALAKASFHNVSLQNAVTEPISKEEIERLDHVRLMVMRTPTRLLMREWHIGRWDWGHTPDEEERCDSAHCIAGWLQALSPDVNIRRMDPSQAGRHLVPTQTHMFYATDAAALEWLEHRLYAKNVVN